MVKTKVVFVCQECGQQAPKWMGKCNACGEFNTFVEESPILESSAGRPVLSEERPVPITEVHAEERPRMTTALSEFDRVLGGGIVVGSVVLVGGEPGIGKSTLLLQIAQRIAATAGKVLYVSSEESMMQTRLRADRLGVSSDNLLVVSETNLDRIRKYMEEEKPSLVIVDSIQMIYRPEIPSAPGSVAQVRECASDLTTHAKRHGISLFIVGHVTKDGGIAGPKTLEHLVDAVLYFEGDRFQTFRILRGVKNRFGSTNEMGIFEMVAEGLREVTNPSELFLSQDRSRRVGSVVVPSQIGTRTLLVEIQALTSRTAFPAPTRRASGVDFNRMSLISAVLSRRIGMDLGGVDIYVNAVGGVDLEEPAADLGVALAIASSFSNRAIDSRICAFGEVGLSAEVRGTTQAGNRVLEAKRLGFQKAIVSADSVRAIGKTEGIEVVTVRTLHEALEAAVVL
ncbi:MAG: DNA repair protein RadA [Planctomycetota bacterium]|nr:DNA repair protein RadA [Planctomycetota bacterium]